MARNQTPTVPFAICLAVLYCAASAPALDLPPNQLLLDSKPDAFRLVGQAASQASAKFISVQGPAFDHAWHVEVRQQPQAEYQIQLAAPVPAKFQPGDSVLLSLWARATTSTGPNHQGSVGLVLEQSADPYDKVFSRRFDLNSDWHRFDVAAKLTPNFTRTGLQLALRVGYFPQTIEIGGIALRQFDPSVSLVDLPQTAMTYRGRDPNALWRRRSRSAHRIPPQIPADGSRHRFRRQSRPRRVYSNPHDPPGLRLRLRLQRPRFPR